MDFLASRDPSFEIGERVVIRAMLAMPAKRKRYIGKEGIIRSKHLMGGLWIGRVGYLVELRHESIELPGNCLERVIPQGSVKGSWDDCLWKPPSV